MIVPYPVCGIKSNVVKFNSHLATSTRLFLWLNVNFFNETLPLAKTRREERSRDHLTVPTIVGLVFMSYSGHLSKVRY